MRYLKDSAMKGIGLLTQIDMLRPGLMGSYDDLGERYCGAKVQVAPGKMDWRCVAFPLLSCSSV